MTDIIFETDIHNCPECDNILSAAGCIEGVDPPVEGDLSLCLWCGAYLEYGPNLKPIKIKEETLDSLSADELFAYTQERNKILAFLSWKKQQEQYK